MDLNDLFDFEIKPVDNKRLKRLLLKKLGYNIEHLHNLSTYEKVGVRGAQILNSVNPRLRNPVILIFAADHGISLALSEFLRHEPETEESLLSFLHGTSAVNAFAKNSNLDVKAIDVGVDHSFEGTLTYWLNHGTKFINRKQAYRSRDFHEFPAITTSELQSGMQVGMEIVDRERKTGCNVIGFGQLGRGGKLSAWSMASTLLDVQLTSFKLNENPELIAYLDKAIKIHPKTHDVYTLLCLFGGYDMAAIVGGMLRAAHHNMIVLVDGLYTAVAAYAAYKVSPDILDYLVFSHASEDPVHNAILKELNAEPLWVGNISSNMGSGIAYSFPLFKNAMSLF